MAASGFSLVELLVVLVIIGAAMGLLAGFTRSGLSGLHLRGSARDLVATLRYARERAVTQQVTHKVVFSMQDHKLYVADELERSRRPLQLNPDVRFRRIRIDGVDVRGRDLIGEIVFLPNGSSNPAEIVLENSRGGKMKVVTDLLTGAAKTVPLGPGD